MVRAFAWRALSIRLHWKAHSRDPCRPITCAHRFESWSNIGQYRTTARADDSPQCANVLSFADLRHVPENRRKAALDASLRAAHSQHFDLTRGLYGACGDRLPETRTFCTSQ